MAPKRGLARSSLFAPGERCVDRDEKGRLTMNQDENVSGYSDVVTGSRDGPPRPPGAAQVRGASVPELKSLLGIAITAIVIAALYFAKDVLIPITLAVMLSFVLSPVVDMLQRLRLWRAPAVIVTVLAALGLFALIGTLIGSQAAALTANAPQYAQTVEAKIEGVQNFAVTHIASLTQMFGSKLHVPGTAPPAHGPISKPAPATAPPTILTQPEAQGERKPVLVEMEQQQTSPFKIALAVLEPVLGPLETLVIVLIVAIFVLMQKEDLRDRFIRVFGSSDLHRTTLAMDDAGQRLSRYFLSQLAVNTSFGLIIGLGLWLIGIPSPAMFGILAGLLRFVPYIGSALAAIVPMALGAAIDPGWSTVIYVATLFAVVEPVMGYIVEPMLYGHSTGLSPISVIVAAVFWTWIWGPIGLILSTPLTLCLVVMGRHVKSLEFFDVLLGDRPALGPVETFYQRILADNPDEALAHAETLLNDRPLIDYYDGVVVQALKLAALDEARGTIDRPLAAHMNRTMLEVIGDLDDHVELGAEAQGVEPVIGAVACLAGRGPFDDAVAAMLVQVLRERGIVPRLIPHDEAGRNRIAALDLTGVKVIALSYLELAGAPAHLRFLIRRLRQRAPDARIVVGLWPEGDVALHDPDAQAQIGADAVAGTLHGAAAAIRLELGSDMIDALMAG
jgi:predicted PurR-regulated permease PerM